jgi:hypothetical protein
MLSRSVVDRKFRIKAAHARALNDSEGPPCRAAGGLTNNAGGDQLSEQAKGCCGAIDRWSARPAL